MKKNIKIYEILMESMRAMEDIIDRIVTKNEMQVILSFFRNYCPILENVIQKSEEDTPIIGFNFAFPQEIFHCFNCIPICFESIPYILSSLLPEGAEYFYDIANNLGHAYHTCTSQKGIMGILLENLLEVDLIVTPTAPCDNAVGSYQWFANQLNIPSIFIDLPQYHDERAYQYFSGEFFRLIEEIGRILNQKPDYNKLIEAVSYSRKVHKNLLEIHEMRKVIPSPLESMSNATLAAATTLMPPSPEKVQFFKEVKDIAKYRVKHHLSRTGFEQSRSIWPYMSIFFDFSIYEYMDRKLGMTQLVDLFGYYYYEPIYTKNVDEIIYQLARQALEYPMIHQSNSFVETLINDSIWIAKEYQADSAVITEHIGCKQMAAISQLFKEALRDEGIPTLIIELDVADKRVTSYESIKNQLSEFSKTLL